MVNDRALPPERGRMYVCVCYVGGGVRKRLAETQRNESDCIQPIRLDRSVNECRNCFRGWNAFFFVYFFKLDKRGGPCYYEPDIMCMIPFPLLLG